MTWRRCSEEMPERYREVLAWIIEQDDAPAYPVIAFVDEHDNWRVPPWGDDEPVWTATGVRYWQPITPPDEGTPHGNSDERTA